MVTKEVFSKLVSFNTMDKMLLFDEETTGLRTL